MLPRTRVRPLDQLRAALRVVADRPAGAVSAAVGMGVGVGALVAALGLAAAAAAQGGGVARGDVPGEVAVVADDGGEAGEPFPDDAVARVAARPGVRSAGLLYPVDLPSATLTGPAAGGSGAPSVAGTVDVYAADPAAFDALRPRLAWGRIPDHGNERRRDRVMVLSASLAERVGLGNGAADGTATVLLGGIPYAVLGALDDVGSHTELLDAVMIPAATAREVHGGSPLRLVVRTDPGATGTVAAQVASILDPLAPERYQVEVSEVARAPAPRLGPTARNALVATAVLGLVLGAAAVANVVSRAAVERVDDIGLRRAAGARRRHVVAQLVLESGLVGLAGAVLGTWAGMTAVVWVAAARRWEPVVDVRALVAGLAVGALVSAVAGLFPALRASGEQAAAASPPPS